MPRLEFIEGQGHFRKPHRRSSCWTRCPCICATTSTKSHAARIYARAPWMSTEISQRSDASEPIQEVYIYICRIDSIDVSLTDSTEGHVSLCASEPLRHVLVRVAGPGPGISLDINHQLSFVQEKFRLCFRHLCKDAVEEVVAQRHDTIFTDGHHARSTLCILSGSCLWLMTCGSQVSGLYDLGSATRWPGVALLGCVRGARKHTLLGQLGQLLAPRSVKSRKANRAFRGPSRP